MNRDVQIGIAADAVRVVPAAFSVDLHACVLNGSTKGNGKARVKL